MPTLTQFFIDKDKVEGNIETIFAILDDRFGKTAGIPFS